MSTKKIQPVVGTGEAPSQAMLDLQKAMEEVSGVSDDDNSSDDDRSKSPAKLEETKPSNSKTTEFPPLNIQVPVHGAPKVDAPPGGNVPEGCVAAIPAFSAVDLMRIDAQIQAIVKKAGVEVQDMVKSVLRPEKTAPGGLNLPQRRGGTKVGFNVKPKLLDPPTVQLQPGAHSQHAPPKPCQRSRQSTVKKDDHRITTLRQRLPKESTGTSITSWSPEKLLSQNNIAPKRSMKRSRFTLIPHKLSSVTASGRRRTQMSPA